MATKDEDSSYIDGSAEVVYDGRVVTLQHKPSRDKSNPIALDIPGDCQGVMISARTQTVGDYQLWVSTCDGGEWRDWQEMHDDHESSNGSSRIFGQSRLESPFDSIRFKSSVTLMDSVTFVLFIL